MHRLNSLNVQNSDLEKPVHGGNLNWAAGLAGCPPSFILDFSASINPLGPPASAIAAIHSNISNLRDYPDPSYRELRQALGRFHNISADWVLPGNGSAELLTWACRELATLEITYLVTPAFRDYLRALEAFSANWVGLEDLTGQIPQLQLIAPNSGFLFNNPHNPTGYLSVRDTLKPYLEQAALVVVDEAFMDFLPPSEQESVIDWVADYSNLVVLRSLTKFYSLPGLRLGYAIAHPNRLKRWQQWRDPWSVNTLAAAAAIATVQDTDFQQKTWDWLPEARSHLFNGLSKIPGLTPLPGAANFLLVQSARSTVDLQRELLQRSRILIRDCVSFPELGDRFFRVAVRTQAENEELLKALTESALTESS